MSETLCLDRLPDEEVDIPYPTSSPAGEQAGAFTDVVSANYDLIINYIRTHFPDLEGVAEDLTQETFARAFAGFDNFNHESKTSTWLITIAVNRSIDELRKRGREPKFVDDEDVLDFIPGKDTDHIIDGLESVEALKIVKDALSSLPEIYQDAFAARIFQDLPYLDIAELENASLSTIKWRIYKARQTVIEAFESKD
jgi:RNA polymerase sigma-70 factor (ECF subfamily)